MKSLNFKLSIFLLLFFSFTLFAETHERGGQELILPNNFVYDDLIAIQLENGILSFSDQSPITIQELKAFLYEVEYESLSAIGKKKYEAILEFLKEERFITSFTPFYMNTSPIFSPEFYYRNESETPWILDYTKKANMIELPLQFGIGDYCAALLQLSIGQSYKGREDPTQFINQGFTYETGDAYISHENYISGGYTWNDNVGFNLRVGVGTQSIGRSLLPSIMMSEYLTDAPNFNLRFFSPIFNYNWNITQLTQKTTFYSHRLDFRFSKKVEISLMEGILPYGHFDFRMLNPFGIYHGMALFREYYGESSSYLGIKFAYVPIKYIRIYGLFSQNEFTLPFEAELGNTEPNGLGGQIGIESYIPTQKGFLHFGGEFYYSTPYMFVKQSPNVSFAKVYEELVPGTGNRYQWMGNPFGPDTIAGKIIIGYENNNVWSVEASYTLAALGEFAGNSLFKRVGWDFDNLKQADNNSNWVYITNPEYSDGAKYKTPHGIVEYENLISIKGIWYPTKYLTTIIQPGFKIINNSNHIVNNNKFGFEVALAIKLDISKIGNYNKHLKIK